MALLVLALVVFSSVPAAQAAAAATAGCAAGFSHVRAGKATMKFDANHNGWLCRKAARTGGKTTYAFRDDKI